MQHKSSGHCPSDVSAKLWALLTWFVRTPCVLHSLHNSLKWSMFAQFSDLQLMKDLWAVFASLRESFDLLETHLALWLDSVLLPTPLDQLPSEEDLVALWTALNVEPRLIDLLASEWHLYWDFSCGRLRVAEHCLYSDDFYENLTGAMISCWS